MAIDQPGHLKEATWYGVLTTLSVVVLFPVYDTFRAPSIAAYVRRGQPPYPIPIEWNVKSRAIDLGNLDQKFIVKRSSRS